MNQRGFPFIKHQEQFNQNSLESSVAPSRLGAPLGRLDVSKPGSKSEASGVSLKFTLGAGILHQLLFG